MAEHKILIDDAEDAWDESVAAGVTSVLDNADYKVGAGSAKISPDATVAAGTILATEAMAPVDLSDCKIAKLWIKSSVDTALGDLQILLDNNASCASPEETLDVPALSAGVWSLCDLPLANPESDTAIISVGLKYVTDLGACDIRVDDVNGCIVTPEYAQTLIRGWYPTLDKSIPVKVGDDGTVQVFDPAVFNSLVVYEGTATADGPDTSTITDTVLATKPDFNGQLVVITSGDYKGQTRDIDQATNIGGGKVHAAAAFGGIIVEGVTFVILSIRPTTAEVADIEAKIGAPTDGGAAATLFGRHKKLDTAVHAHLLLVVHNASALNADLDTPLKSLLEDFGFEVEVADPDDVDGNLELNFDGVIVSASCVDADKTKLADLKYVDCPVVVHSAEIAVSAVFNLGTTAGTRAAQTTVEIVDNTVQWFLDQATGDLEVTAAATIYTIGTKTANAITLAEEAIATGDDITCLVLFQGQEDGGDPAYAPDFDRVFFGLGDAGKANNTAKAIYFSLYEHLLHEKRFSPEVVVTPKRVYQEDIPDKDVSDTATTTEDECILLDIGPKQNRRFCLRHLRVKAQADPVANTMTVRLYEYFHDALTEMDSFDITTANYATYHSLMDMFAVSEVHSDAIRVTCKMNADTLSVKATYSYAEAKK